MQVLRVAVILTYVVIDGAAVMQWLPLSCCLTQLLSVPAVSSIRLTQGPLMKGACAFTRHEVLQSQGFMGHMP